VPADALERPLPRPSDAAYVEARLLEALVEARLALRFLEEGLTRNATGKAFQAWKALLAALLRLELERLKALVKTEEERRWLETTAALRVPTAKMKSLARLLEEVGYANLAVWTGNVLLLHDYQYHGPDAEGWVKRRNTAGGSVGVFNPHELTRLISAAMEASTISPSLLEFGMI